MSRAWPHPLPAHCTIIQCIESWCTSIFVHFNLVVAVQFRGSTLSVRRHLFDICDIAYHRAWTSIAKRHKEQYFSCFWTGCDENRKYWNILTSPLTHFHIRLHLRNTTSPRALVWRSSSYWLFTLQNYASQPYVEFQADWPLDKACFGVMRPSRLVDAFLPYCSLSKVGKCAHQSTCLETWRTGFESAIGQQGTHVQ